MINWINSEKMDKASLLEFQQALREVPPFPPAVRCLDLGERFMALDMATAFADHGPRVMTANPHAGDTWDDFPDTNAPLHTANWSVTMKTINEVYDELVSANEGQDLLAGISSYEAILDQVETKADPTTPEGKERYLGVGGTPATLGEYWGYAISALMAPMNPGRAHFIQQQHSSLVSLALDLHEHRLTHGEFPEDLSVLGENAGFDLGGAPLQVRETAEHLLIYSVGIDRQDNGGPNSDSETDDIGITLRKF